MTFSYIKILSFILLIFTANLIQLHYILLWNQISVGCHKQVDEAVLDEGAILIAGCHVDPTGGGARNQWNIL